MQKRKKNIALHLVLGIFGYAFLMFLIIRLSAMNSVIKIGKAEIKTDGLCGTFAALQTLINVSMVLYCKKKGFIATVLLYSLNITYLLISILFINRWSVLPGIMSSLSALITIFVLKSCLNKIEADENKMRELAGSDSLTQLPNRRNLHVTLDKLLREKKLFALVFIDLDNFKNINDTMGHDYGDEVLCEITRRWNSIKGENDYIARLGGDEFAMIITDFNDKKSVETKAERYLFCFRDKFVINSKNFYISASMGVSFFPDDSDDKTKLLRYSDTAMYMAKQKGKHRVCVFNSEHMETVKEDVESENYLRKSVQTENYELVFQPQYIVKEKRLRGFETLVRFRDGDKLLAPYRFIRLAEKLNIVTDIDRWVLKNAMLKFKPAFEINPSLKLSVNISVAYLFDDLFISDMQEFLSLSGVSASNIEVEITETLFISSSEKASEILSNLRSMGITIALDDFGTGYASLSYLTSLPIDVLKIDKSFIDKLPDDAKGNEFVGAIIYMGHLLNMEVIAEGVEQEVQYNMLSKFSCDTIQGYYLGKPEDYDKALDSVYDDAVK